MTRKQQNRSTQNPFFDKEKLHHNIETSHEYSGVVDVSVHKSTIKRHLNECKYNKLQTTGNFKNRQSDETLTKILNKKKKPHMFWNHILWIRLIGYDEFGTDICITPSGHSFVDLKKQSILV